MDAAPDNNYLARLDEFNRNMSNIDLVLQSYTGKSVDIDKKVDMLNLKTTLQLEDSTHLLKFQNTVIRNEMLYITTMKGIVTHASHNQFFAISENITMVAASYLNIYKDIGNPVDGKSPEIGKTMECHSVVKMSNRKYTLAKIITEIGANMNFIRDLLNDLKNFNKKLTGEMATGNFHCKTLQNDIENKYSHIEIEYQKFQTAMEKNISYFTDFSSILYNHVQNPKLHAFCI